MTAGSASLKWTCQTRSRNSRTAATGSPPAPNVQCPVSRHSPRIDGSVMSNRRRASASVSIRVPMCWWMTVRIPASSMTRRATWLAPSANTCHWSAGMPSDGRTRPAMLVR